jgi:hypothetical protein
MDKVQAQAIMSLDGYVANPEDWVAELLTWYTGAPRGRTSRSP